jgi:uncharacterized protein (TIGR03435 family)
MRFFAVTPTSLLVGAGLAAAAVCTWAAQSGGPRPVFEVASVKLAPSPASCPECRRRLASDPGRIDYQYIQLVELIRQAYGVTWELESGTGPASIWSERYDIQAKIPPGASKDQLPLMLQALLEERFRLVVHRETKQRPVYALVVAKGGLKIQPVDPEPERTENRGTGKAVPGGYRITYDRITMDRLAVVIRLDHPVVNMTGIEGVFSFTLEYAREDALKAAPPNADGSVASDADSAAPLPPLGKALDDRVGLVLERRVVPVDVFIVDHAERAPTDN